MSGGGVFNVGSYQVAGMPYLTGGLLSAGQQSTHNFPAVTKRLQVRIVDNTGSASSVRVHFGNDSVNNPRVIAGNHYWTVSKSGSIEDSLDADIKCKTVYVSFDRAVGTTVRYQLFAELTSISAQDMWVLTGSGITD